MHTLAGTLRAARVLLVITAVIMRLCRSMFVERIVRGSAVCTSDC